MDDTNDRHIGLGIAVVILVYTFSVVTVPYNRAVKLDMHGFQNNPENVFTKTAQGSGRNLRICSKLGNVSLINLLNFF